MFEETAPAVPLHLRPETGEVTRLRDVLGLDRCKLKPYAHQVIGVHALVTHPAFALFDEMGAGKTIQTLVAAQILFQQKAIDRLLIISPAAVRGVWYDPELGEIRKHLFDNVSIKVTEFHSKSRSWERKVDGQKTLEIIVTNYELLGRSKTRVDQLAPFCTPKTMIAFDESSSVKNYRASQTKACVRLRNLCGRAVLLNGTPIANNPLDMFSQGNLLTPRILDCKYITLYRARYAVMANHHNFPQIIGWRNLEDLQRRFAPYVLRRLKKDCLDLPPKLPPVTLECALDDVEWGHYKAMRDEMVAWLNDSSVSIAGQAITKAIRLAQITSGILGGLEYEDLGDDFDAVDEGRQSFILPFEGGGSAHKQSAYRGPVQIIGTSKRKLVMEWWKERLLEDPNLKLLVFGRFKPEVLGLFEEAQLTGVPSGLIIGGQKKADREAAIRLLTLETAPAGPAFVAGTYGTGSKGLTLTACHTILNCSFDYSLEKSLQSSDRIHRPTQTSPCSFFDVVAVGPAGQKTIDHAIVKARRTKEDVANWTTSAWLSALTDE